MIAIDRRKLMISAMAMAGTTALAGRAWAQTAAGSDALLDEALATEGAPPAIAAGIVTREGLEWSGVRGVRRFGGTDPITLEDRWHIGSNTKAMTAAVFARLVEQNRARWAMPLSEAFPGATIDPALAAITIDDLMRHKAGLVDAAALPTSLVARADPRPVTEQRAAIAMNALSRAPTGEVGTYAYANINYVLVGAAIERISGRSWEEMIQTELFAPLGMASAGFGAPTTNTSGGPNAWGHQVTAGVLTPVDPASPGSDNPPMLGPAGRAHMTLSDYARWTQAMIGGAPEGWLRPERIGVLTTALPGDSYAMGWITGPAAWASGAQTIAHEGSNTLWHAIVVAAPERGLGFVVLSNGGFQGRSAAVPLVRKLIAARTA
jgi:D-alanyl-D-alanine carboxypeptidase